MRIVRSAPAAFSLSLLLSLAAAGADETEAPSAGRDALAALTAGGPDLARLSSTRIQWPEASEIESFFALGFSTDGWFVHAGRLHGLCLEEAGAHCRGDSARFEVSLFNVTCDRRCTGDILPAAGKICQCSESVTARELEELGVGPREGLQFGEFPARFGDVEYDVELTFRENAIYPMVKIEPWVPEFPETRAFLIAGAGERRLFARIDHNHMPALQSCYAWVDDQHVGPRTRPGQPAAARAIRHTRGGSSSPRPLGASWPAGEDSRSQLRRLQLLARILAGTG